MSDERNGRLIGPLADSEWLNVVPWGFGKLLVYIQVRHSSITGTVGGRPPIDAGFMT